MWTAVAATPLVPEKQIDIVSRSQAAPSLRAAPAQMSTTHLPSRYTLAAPPPPKVTTCLRSTFATGSKRGSYSPWMMTSFLVKASFKKATFVELNKKSATKIVTDPQIQPDVGTHARKRFSCGKS